MIAIVTHPFGADLLFILDNEVISSHFVQTDHVAGLLRNAAPIDLDKVDKGLKSLLLNNSYTKDIDEVYEYTTNVNNASQPVKQLAAAKKAPAKKAAAKSPGTKKK